MLGGCTQSTRSSPRSSSRAPAAAQSAVVTPAPIATTPHAHRPALVAATIYQLSAADGQTFAVRAWRHSHVNDSALGMSGGGSRPRQVLIDIRPRRGDRLSGCQRPSHKPGALHGRRCPLSPAWGTAAGEAGLARQDRASLVHRSRRARTRPWGIHGDGS